MTDGPVARDRSAGRAFAVYTVLRFLVFALVTVALFGVGVAIVAGTGHPVDWRSTRVLLLAAAFVAAPVSLLVSYFALRRQRDEMTLAVAARVERYRSKVASRTAAEDAYAEQLLREQQAGAVGAADAAGAVGAPGAVGAVGAAGTADAGRSGGEPARAAGPADAGPAGRGQRP